MPKEPHAYIPAPSIGHELGVMFGFIGVMIVCSVIYGLLWQKANKTSQRKEVERIEKLRASGLLDREKEKERSGQFREGTGGEEVVGGDGFCGVR
ncbi:hypothetical protein CC80DRAFT_592208 [Byssothecium circinans]|uniref:Uncharacterized protein n=1 Tax=Byssothecium circinans TaxID=147558 RepID=A0A6A5TYI6_9PLEO|nr:hypothetical protein CC80DRAFT_592208 [Byssothecium circinans]